MANKKSEKAIKARELYNRGMKLVEIANKLNVPDGTVRRWKSTQNWDRNESERSDSKSERSSKKRIERTQQIDDGTKETLQNEELTPEQQMFCIYYSRTFNATQSYINAYGCTYETAMVNGCKLLRNTKVRAEIQRLKELKAQQIIAGTNDVVEMQMSIAFSDIGNVLSFGKKEVETKAGNTIEISAVDLKESCNVDTRLIKKVSEGRDGISVEMKDSQKALDWLAVYFEMNPADVHKREFDKRKLELELMKMEIGATGSDNDAPVKDNFLDALNTSAKEVWSDD